MASSKEKKTICHLHFTDWPDHGVPQDPKHFLGKYTPLAYEKLNEMAFLFLPLI